MKKYIIFDFDGTLLQSNSSNKKVILDYISEHFPETDISYTSSYLHDTAWKPLKVQLEHILRGEDIDFEKITLDIYTLLQDVPASLFDGVPEIIQKFSQNYTLFLSTGSSTKYAKMHLQDGWIDTCFQEIYGSDVVPKWPDHIHIFTDSSEDDRFCEYAIFVWDGNNDREVAKNAGIDFIHIWNSGTDKYEIESVAEIECILKSYVYDMHIGHKQHKP